MQGLQNTLVSFYKSKKATMETILTYAGYSILIMLGIFFSWQLRGGIVFAVLFVIIMWLSEDLNPVAMFAAYFLGVPIAALIGIAFQDGTEYLIDNYIKRPNGYK